MIDSKKAIYKQLACVAIGEAICVALMFGVYALLGKFDLSVVLGGLVGLLVSVGNFFFLVVTATVASDKAAAGDATSGQKLMRSSYPIRLLAMAGVLILCAKSGVFDVVALVVPLVFVRPALMVAEFLKKKGE